RESEGFSDPVLDLLRIAGFDDRHLEMLHQRATIAGYLRAGGMWVVAADDDCSAFLAAQAVLVTVVDDVDWVRRHVQSDTLHDGYRIDANIHRSVEGGCALGLVVGHFAPESDLAENVCVLFENCEDFGYG